jgi:hypothetical protein
MRMVGTLAALSLIFCSSVFAQPRALRRDPEGSAVMTALPVNQYLVMAGFPQQGYIEVPADVFLDTPEMTVEAWVSVSDAYHQCSSIAGNGWVSGWWLGVCGTTMRSYFNGSSSQKTGGEMPPTPDTWIHIAAVTDGVTRRHYINGILVLEGDETPASSSPGAIRIGSDVNYEFMPQGVIDDLRIWRVARTQSEIAETMYLGFTPFLLSDPRFESLEAWYRFEGDAMDSWHTHHGTITGTGLSFAEGRVFTPPIRRSVSHR